MMSHQKGERKPETAVVVAAETAVLIAHPPVAVLSEAQTAARALQDVISAKPNKVMMGGEQYLEFEDWQTVGRFYGVTAREDGEAHFVDFGGVRGFKASAEAVDRDGRVLSRATAYCLTDEEKWRARPKHVWLYATRAGELVEDDPGPDNIVWEANPNKQGKVRPKRVKTVVGEEPVPLFQLASMAQTRANAKALRNVLSWVVVLAGYRPTPAEELESVAERVDAEAQAEQSESIKPTGPAAGEFKALADEIRQKRSGKPAEASQAPECPRCKTARSVIRNTADEWVCVRTKGGCGTVVGRAS